MARYKHIDTSPRFLAVDLSKQLLLGSFEHALNHLIDHELDLSGFDQRYQNDAKGATAYPPAVLLKVVLFAYSQGIVGSRPIERACRDHVTFIALSGDQAPHFTTLAHFVSSLGGEIAGLFTAVLAICDRQGLIGREMFAIDGVKLPSNAAKARSGTRAEFQRQADKLEAAVKVMLARHREEDGRAVEPDLRARETKRIERLSRDAEQIREWLTAHPHDRQGAKGAIRKSNRTDNDSAKMATGKGVIQGYCGVAAVDAKHQIVVEAQAHGTGSEHSLLVPVVTALTPLMVKGGQVDKAGEEDKAGREGMGTLITADAGYHAEANLAALAEMEVDALIADNQMRGRDERFADQAKYQDQPDPLHDKGAARKEGLFRPDDFTYDLEARTCICPAGHALHSSGANCTANGRTHHKFQGSLTTCGGCALRAKCLRHPDKTPTRQVAFFAKHQPSPLPHTQRMKEKIDSDEGRRRYGQRFATVEPVFGNVRHNKGLDRFTLRGQTKVDGQWKLYCLVHNIEKLAHHGYAMPGRAARSG